MEFDVIVVGAGTAGCMAAAQIARRTDLTIGVVEAGGRYPGWALHAPLAGLRLRRFWSWQHHTAPVAGLANRSVTFPMGKVIGGTSAVNAMIAAAGHPQDYQFLTESKSTEVSIKRFQEDLTALGVQIQAPRHCSSFTKAFLQACHEEGLSRTDSLDGSLSETCGTFRLFQNHGCRWSAAHLLRDTRCRERIHVLRNTMARKVMLHGTRAVGVETGSSLSTGAIKARVGVLLAAGAIHTPCILQRSGIGPKALLESSGIRVVEDLPGVGQNFQDHVGVPWVVPSRVPAPGRPSRWLPAAIQFMTCRNGIMTSNCCEAGCFLGEGGARPTIEVFTHFQTTKHPNAVEFSTVLLHPKSRGEVGLNPANPWGPPRIDPQYFSSGDDLSCLAEGLRRTIRIANSDALLRYGLQDSDEDVAPDWIRRHAATHYHPAGTCLQGDDALGVVTRGFQVHRTDALWVADMSVVPEVPGGHTATTALLIGAKAGFEIATNRGAGSNQ